MQMGCIITHTSHYERFTMSDTGCEKCAISMLTRSEGAGAGAGAGVWGLGWSKTARAPPLGEGAGAGGCAAAVGDSVPGCGPFSAAPLEACESGHLENMKRLTLATPRR